jgi:excisionase family DNA binding protein
MLSITQAARFLGVSVDHVRTRIEQGQLPAHRDHNGRWLVPRADVGSIDGQGLQLDLRAGDEPTVLANQTDLLATQAAILLAKTQAAAARLQSQHYFRRMKDATAEAEASRQARVHADRALAEAEETLAHLRRSQAVAEAKIEELQKQLANDDRHFQFMVDRITSLEWERQRLSGALGWFGRLRYRRMVTNPSPAPGYDARDAVVATNPSPPSGDIGLDDRPPPPDPSNSVPPPSRRPGLAVDPTRTVPDTDLMA